MKRLLFLLILVLLFIPAQAQDYSYPTPANLVPEVINTYPHDSEAFTQGLLWHEGVLYESTGLRGESTLREVDLTTGEVIRSVAVDREEEPNYFAEGLELVGDDMLIQLTWQENEALVYDLETFEQIDTFIYEGEGWGLCDDGRYFYMSDSSQYIAIRDIETFDLIGRMLITLNGNPLQPQLLNELECVGDVIYANLWRTDFIVQIDKFTGNVIGVINAEQLLTEADRADLLSGQVLNGIAYNPDEDVFYITGKQWSQIFEVRFVPAEQ